MEELVIKIGEMLDEKLDKKLGEVLDEKLDKKLGEILDEKLDKKLDEKLDKKLDVKLQKLKTDMTNELDEKIQNLSVTFDMKMQQMSDDFNTQIVELREDMLDQFFLFESEYGDRILAIGDSALLDNEKNRERCKKMHELEERMNRNEVRIDACQNDIFKLKQKIR